MNKNNTIISKFEEFFGTEYKDQVFEILEKYPDERSLIIDYKKLEIFDPTLADLLVDKPEEVLYAAQTCIKNIDPLVKDAEINIRFFNFSNGAGLDMVNSYNIGRFITINCTIENVQEVHPFIKTGVFECKGCMRLHEVEQTSSNTILEPSLCSECGGRSFRLLQEDSLYIDSQLLIVGYPGTNQKLKLVLRDDLCSYDDFYNGLRMNVSGVLKTFRNSKNLFEKYLLVNNFVLIEKEDLISDELYVDLDNDESRRGSPEYNNWVKNVISNSGDVCQCCGGDKHLVAHHIFSYKNHPDYRLDSNNGIALCKWCHGKYHSYYGKDANPRTLIEFLNRFGNSKKEILFLNKPIETIGVEKESLDSPVGDVVHLNKKDEDSLDKNDEMFQSFINIVNSFAKKSDKGCSIKLLKETCKSKGLSEEFVDEKIKGALQRGLVYQPWKGYLKVV